MGLSPSESRAKAFDAKHALKRLSPTPQHPRFVVVICEIEDRGRHSDVSRTRRRRNGTTAGAAPQLAEGLSLLSSKCYTSTAKRHTSHWVASGRIDRLA